VTELNEPIALCVPGVLGMADGIERCEGVCLCGEVII
jgi:hypothetical protein